MQLLWQALQQDANGKSIWMLDVLSDHDFEIDGFDLSLAQCPPKSQWAKNCSFYEWDVQRELPERFHGVYDVVHVRLVLAGLKESPILALQNLVKMLSTLFANIEIKDG